MKILLANPLYKQDINKHYEKYFVRSGSRWPHSGVKRKKTIPHYLPFPFYLAYSASLLKENNFDVYALDAVALDICEQDFLKKIREISPDLVFYEVTTPTIEYDLYLAQKIKENIPTKVVIGGAHATIFSSQILKENMEIDFILRGEYEYSLLNLAKLIKAEKKDFSAGIVFRDKEAIVDLGCPCLIEPLDKLPFPYRDIFPSNEHPNPSVYWDGFCQLHPALQMHSSRGCPYRCYFCLWNQVLYRNGKYRTFSSQRVVDEMQKLKFKYGAKEIYFDDDDFTIKKEHVLSICEEIKKRNLNIKWSCMADAINLDEGLINRMAQSGCIGIKFGVESASPRIIMNLGKPLNLEKVKNITKWCRNNSIKTHSTFTLGLLEETDGDIEKTVKFAQGLDVDSIQISITTPFPGTRFFDIVKEKKYLRSEDWQKYDGKISEIVSYPHLDWEKVERVRKKCLYYWFIGKLISPLWMINHYFIILRTLKGLGIRFFLRQIFSVIIDELNND